jgi:hypothetical protein
MKQRFELMAKVGGSAKVQEKAKAKAKAKDINIKSIGRCNMLILLRIVVTIVFLTVPASAWAACDDVKEAAGGAAKQRIDDAKKIIDDGMATGEQTRSNIAGCLDTIATQGDQYSMGAHVLDLDSIVQGLCKQAVDFASQQASSAVAKVTAPLKQVSDVFQVNGDPNQMAIDLLRKSGF